MTKLKTCSVLLLLSGILPVSSLLGQSESGSDQTEEQVGRTGDKSPQGDQAEQAEDQTKNLKSTESESDSTSPVDGKQASSNTDPKNGDHPAPKNDQSSGTAIEGQSSPIGLSADAEEKKMVFNRFNVHLLFGRPKFGDDLAVYEDFYGKESILGGFRVDWYFLRFKYLAVGGLFQSSYYFDSGYASKSGVAYEKDDSAPIDLIMVPLQFGLVAQASPFPWKWLVLSGWYGGEQLYYQESRGKSSAAKVENNNSEGSLTNKGWKTHIFMGAAVNLLLNFLDQKSVSSGEILGIQRVYLSPFVEKSFPAKSSNEPGLKFTRTLYGIAFTFETRGT